MTWFVTVVAQVSLSATRAVVDPLYSVVASFAVARRTMIPHDVHIIANEPHVNTRSHHNCVGTS